MERIKPRRGSQVRGGTPFHGTIDGTWSPGLAVRIPRGHPHALLDLGNPRAVGSRKRRALVSNAGLVRRLDVRSRRILRDSTSRLSPVVTSSAAPRAST